MDCTHKSNILSMDRPLPRYTSYPPAPFFQKITNDTERTEWYLQKLGPDSKLSLYFHIPFCPKLCWYCGCNTKITRRYSPIEDYINLIIDEMDIVSKNLPYKNVVRNIHFGGGSPSIINAVDFDKIMKRIKESFNLSQDVEISIELDPRSVTEGRVATYAKHGINRVSLGVQDFNPSVLNAVNRQQPFYLTYHATKLLREYGIKKINFDLMYGLPHQTPKSIIETMQKVSFLRPSRVAFFGYAHVPWLKTHMKIINEMDLPSNEVRYDLFEVGRGELKRSGYEQIGIDHFSRKDDELYQLYKAKKIKRNFQGYTTERADTLIGLGLSSIGRINNRYVQNVSDMACYRKSILDGNIPTNKVFELDKEDILRADLIEKIMCYGEVDVGAMCQSHGFGVAYLDKEILKLADFVNKEILMIKNRMITIIKSPHFVMRLIANAFDAKKDEESSERRHAKAI